MTERERKATHFGFEEVAEEEKATRVAGVFDSVASRYDLMNDVMSVGLHRVWKAFAVRQANVRPGMKVLDIAGGTGDLAKAFAQRAGTSGEVWLTDINGAILGVGRIVNKPVVKKDTVVSEARLGLSLTFDHRIIDGAEAARFMTELVKLVSNPALLLARL